jgi:hypothetical protein
MSIHPECSGKSRESATHPERQFVKDQPGEQPLVGCSREKASSRKSWGTQTKNTSSKAMDTKVDFNSRMA